MKRMIQGLLLAGSLVVGGSALAQGTTQGSAQGSAQQGQPVGGGAKAGRGATQGGMTEHMGFMVPASEQALLERMHHANQMEVQLGKLAQQNAQSQDVKSFGEMLVKDHTAADGKLTAHAQQRGLKLSTPKPMNDVERRIMAAERAAMEKLQVLKGPAFDAAFLAHIVGDHDMTLGRLMAAQQGTIDPAMAPLLQQMIQGVTQHRQQGYTLLGRLGPASVMGVGGAGGANQGMGSDTGSGGSGVGGSTKGSTGNGGQNKMDPGNQKKY